MLNLTQNWSEFKVLISRPANEKSQLESLIRLVSMTYRPRNRTPVGSTSDITPKLCAFVPMIGQKANGELLVCGRAVNGWGGESIHWQMGTELSEQDCSQLSSDCIALSEHGEDSPRCPMLWVTKYWGQRRKNANDSSNYNTNRSSFWKVIREVTSRLGLADINDASWPSYLIWSNLFKISPAHKGNPSWKLMQVETPHCVELLRNEINQFRPKRLLLLTGIDMARPFLRALDLSESEKMSFKYVRYVGRLRDVPTQIVVAEHPQGRPISPLSDEVSEAFRGHLL